MTSPQRCAWIGIASVSRRRGGSLLCALVAIASACAVARGAGETRPFEACVPQEARAAYCGRPSEDMMQAPPGGTVDQLAASIIVLKQMGVIPRNALVLADIIGTIPMLGRRPHAIAMLDV